MMKQLLLYLAVGTCGWTAEAPSVDAVLREAGRAVGDFWEQFSSINCIETVSQLKLSKEGKVVARKESAFDYVALLRQSDEDLVVEESRAALRASQVKKGGPLLVTDGFSTLLFIFHPLFQNSFEYSQPVEEALEGRRVLRVGFRQARDGRSPSCLRLRGRDCPLGWTGTAWMEGSSGAILKIAATLKSTMEDVGLQGLRATVIYAPVKFRDDPKEQWLPSVVTVEAQTAQQRWQNVHRFTNYKLFSVSTRSEPEKLK